MEISYRNKTLNINEFHGVNIIERNIDNIFYCKLNRTLLEMLNKKEYSQLYSEFSEDLKMFGNWSIGRYLKHLKENSNQKYLKFLNKNGDKSYCIFNVPSATVNHKGLYFYRIGDEIKYVGRCLTNFNDRININYGKITPANCYKTGQSTNCHLNSKVNQIDNLSIGFHFMENKDEIKILEKLILESNPDKFEWNVQRR
jgi:hypothetical protein